MPHHSSQSTLTHTQTRTQPKLSDRSTTTARPLIHTYTHTAARFRKCRPYERNIILRMHTTYTHAHGYTTKTYIAYSCIDQIPHQQLIVLLLLMSNMCMRRFSMAAPPPGRRSRIKASLARTTKSAPHALTSRRRHRHRNTHTSRRSIRKRDTDGSARILVQCH